MQQSNGKGALCLLFICLASRCSCPRYNAIKRFFVWMKLTSGNGLGGILGFRGVVGTKARTRTAETKPSYSSLVLLGQGDGAERQGHQGLQKRKKKGKLIFY
jgi:hypothetical protein